VSDTSHHIRSAGFSARLAQDGETGPKGSLVLALLLFSGSCGVNAQTLPGPLLIDPLSAPGDGYELRIELGIEHSDNRARLNPRGPSDTLLVPRLDLTAFRTGRRLDLRTIGQVEFRYSLPDRFEDELRANIRAELDWTLVPNRLAWTFADVAAVESVDVRAVDSPGNLQQTNVLRTGPELRLGLNGPWRGIVRGQFAISQAEESEEFDTNRTSMLARAIRSIGPTRRLLLEVEAADIKVRDARVIAAEHQRGDMLARFFSEGARASVELAAGYTLTDFDVGPSPTEPLGRLELAWKRGDSFRTFLAGSHQLSDAVRDLLNDLESLDPKRIDRSSGIGRRLRVGAEVFILDNIEFGIDYSGLRQRFTMTSFYRNYDFVRGNSALDFSDNGAVVAYTRRLSDTLSVGTALSLERRRFDLESRRDTDLRSSVYLQRRLNRRFAIRSSFGRNQRWSSTSGADSRENVIDLSLIVFGGRL